MDDELDHDATLDLAARPRLRSDVAVVPVGDEAVLYREHTGDLLALDATGRLLCEYLDGVTPIAGMAEELAGAFGEAPDRIADDIVRFFGRLMQHGYLQPGEEGP